MRCLKIIVFMFMLMELGMPPGVEAQAKVTEATLNRLFQEGAQA